MGPRSGRRPYYDSTGNGRDRQEKFGLGRLVACTSTVWPVTLSDSEARVLGAKWSWAKPPDSVRLRERLSKIQEGYRKRQLLAQHKSRLRQGTGRFPETARSNRRPHANHAHYPREDAFPPAKEEGHPHPVRTETFGREPQSGDQVAGSFRSLLKPSASVFSSCSNCFSACLVASCRACCSFDWPITIKVAVLS